MITIATILTTIKTIMVTIMAMNTNAVIVSFITNNLILLIFFYLFVISTPWKWDNFIAKWIKNIIKYVKPDANLPDEED